MGQGNHSDVTHHTQVKNASIGMLLAEDEIHRYNKTMFYENIRKYTNIHVYTYEVHLIQLSWDMSCQVLDHAISRQIAEFNGPGENIETISNYI